jgi:hypothetical protein
MMFDANPALASWANSAVAAKSPIPEKENNCLG